MERRHTSSSEISGSRACRTDNIVETERQKSSGKRGITKTLADKLSNLSWSSNKISLKSGDENNSCKSGPNTSRGRERKQSYSAFERKNSQKLELFLTLDKLNS